MKILVVGAGAVGSVYGWCAHQAGAQVTYLVKTKYRAELTKGLVIYQWKLRSKEPASHRWNDFSILTEIAEVSSQTWDAVLLTFASTALTEAWLNEFLPRIGNATLVSLQPGTRDRDRILKTGKITESQLVMGTIPIISYFAPLPGESMKDWGYAYLLPPGAKVSLQGEDARTEPLLAMFTAGGLPAIKSANTQGDQIVAGVVLRALVAGLEACEWNMDRFLRSPEIRLASEAAREGVPITRKMLALPEASLSFGARVLTGTWTLKQVLRVLRRIFPFNLETYLRVHFTKVGDQMHSGIAEMIAEGRKNRLPVVALEQLRRGASRVH